MPQTKLSLFSPANFVRALTTKQESRPYHFNNLLIFCIFTGIVRGLQEALFFGHPIRNSFILSIIPFYLSMGMMLVFFLNYLLEVSWKRISNAVCIGIFLGLFPPLIDLLVHDSFEGFYYSYYVFWNVSNIPWLWYSPEYNFHPGEAAGLWGCILFTGVYAWTKSKNPKITILALMAGYFTVFYHAVLLGTVSTRIHLGPLTSIESINTYQSYKLKFLTNNLIFWQGFTAFLFYLLIRKELLKQVMKRLPHILPFVLICLAGGYSTSMTINTSLIYTVILVFVMMIAVMAHNDYHDPVHSGRRNRKGSSPLEKTDLPALNVFFIICSISLLFSNIPTVLPLFVFFALSVLYHYPHYRAKKHFLTGLKIEGMWGGSAFLAGVLAAPRPLVSDHVLLAVFLLFGGWSIIAAIKDYKDILDDYHDGHLTVYYWLYKKGIPMKNTHKYLRILVLLFFIVPVAVLFFNRFYIAGILLFLAWIVLGISMSLPRNPGWFRKVLIGINLYFLGLLYSGPQMHQILH
jgi:hypothetical protein